MDDGVLTIIAFILAMLLAVYVGAHAVRWRLRRWIRQELAALWEDTRYTEGYRAALEQLSSSLFTARLHFKIHREGEI